MKCKETQTPILSAPMTFMFLIFGWMVSLGTRTKSLLVCLSKCPFLIFGRRRKSRRRSLTVPKLPRGTSEETHLCKRQKFPPCDVRFQLHVSSHTSEVAQPLTAARWKMRCFLLTLHEFTTFTLRTAPASLDLVPASTRRVYGYSFA